MCSPSERNVCTQILGAQTDNPAAVRVCFIQVLSWKNGSLENRTYLCNIGEPFFFQLRNTIIFCSVMTSLINAKGQVSQNLVHRLANVNNDRNLPYRHSRLCIVWCMPKLPARLYSKKCDGCQCPPLPRCIVAACSADPVALTLSFKALEQVFRFGGLIVHACPCLGS